MAKLNKFFSEKDIPDLNIFTLSKKILLIKTPIRIAIATEPIGIKDAR